MSTASEEKKFSRKEVWERLCRRQSNQSNSAGRYSTSHSNVDQCNVYTSSTVAIESSSDPDLTIFRPPRPTCLQLTSFSFTPESSHETLPSPSATSLKLHMEPSELAVRELSGKSSSAPLLLKHGKSSKLKSSSRKVRYIIQIFVVII